MIVLAYVVAALLIPALLASYVVDSYALADDWNSDDIAPQIEDSDWRPLVERVEREIEIVRWTPAQRHVVYKVYSPFRSARRCSTFHDGSVRSIIGLILWAQRQLGAVDQDHCDDLWRGTRLRVREEVIIPLSEQMVHALMRGFEAPW